MKPIAVTAAVLALGALAQPAAAQSPSAPIATADDCARMASKDAEIACLRQALEQSRRELHGVAEPTPSTTDIVTPAAPPPAAAIAPAASRAVGLGAEQVQARAGRPAAKAAPEVLRAVVDRASEDARGVLTLHLDNGQVWRQAEQPSIPLTLRENAKYSVEIKPSGFGGYRMKFADNNRTIVVNRVE